MDSLDIVIFPHSRIYRYKEINLCVHDKDMFLTCILQCRTLCENLHERQRASINDRAPEHKTSVIGAAVAQW